MQKSITLAVFIGLAIMALSNSGGRALISNAGNTGAPGDELNTNGTFRTCVSCHDGGPIACTMKLECINQFQQVITKYEAGKTYTIRVSINSTSGGLGGYGFQMIGLRKQGNVDTKGFKDQGVNSYHIAPTSNGRAYAEQNAGAPDPIFNVTWVAPAAGTGLMKFYASGAAVNNNGIPGGDGAAITTLELDEMPTSATNLTPDQMTFAIAPQTNPISVADNALNFQVKGAEFEAARCIIFSISGEVLRDESVQINQSGFTITNQTLTPGLYLVKLQKGAETAACKLLVQ
jgi:hypothetical protein